MSQEINNREYRKNVIKEMLHRLHAGETVEQVKQRFNEAFSGVSAAEIAEAEKALVDEGVPVQEVQRLCDVHAAVFKDSVEAGPANADQVPGHPAHTLKAENRALERLIAERIRPGIEALAAGRVTPKSLKADIRALSQVDKHYLRKENLIFPYMERFGITAPPKVMWGVDDEIRDLIKQAEALAEANESAVTDKLQKAVAQIEEMIVKEEQILLPMLAESLTLQEWKHIADESADIGYCLIDPPPAWRPAGSAQTQTLPEQEEPEKEPGSIRMPTGTLTQREITALLNTLPVDITFVGSDDTVRYFSQGTERIFPRTRAVIGRKVTNCHPPASVHIVEGIVNDLRTGKKTHEDFWIRMGEKYVYIRYYAVRDEHGEFLGTLEVTQDIAPIQRIEGEKRLVSE